MKTLFPILLFWLSLSAHAQIPDSIRTELTIEPATSQPTDTSERGFVEKRKLKQLFQSSRKETTMFQLGVASPSDFIFFHSRTLGNRYAYSGFWAGVNHKLTTSLGIRAGASWSPAVLNKTTNRTPNGANWMGLLAVDYYLFIQKRIRAGKTAGNFLNNPYITLESWRPLSGTMATESKGGATYALVPFRQSIGLGIGSISTRTRFYYFGVSATVAYWFGRPAEVQRAIQPMVLTTAGFGF